MKIAGPLSLELFRIATILGSADGADGSPLSSNSPLALLLLAVKFWPSVILLDPPKRKDRAARGMEG